MRALVGGGAALMLATTVLLTGPATAANEDSVTRWAQRHAAAVPSDPARPGADLAVVSRATAGARIIGLGEPGHLLSEVTTSQTRYLRHLVSHGGVRSVVLESDVSLTVAVNDYVLARRDDLSAILGSLENIWQTTEIRDMIAWLRAYNDVHADKVQVAGAEYFMTSAPAYDAVDAFVATHEPERLDEVRSYLRTVRPTRSIGDHLQWYYYELSAEEKKPYMAAAAALHDVVEQVDAGRDTMALQHARQIHWWYEAYSLATEADISIYRDEKAARNVRWWARHTGDRTVYWAASAHVADAPRMTLAVDGVSAGSFASAGSFLERWYGAAYVPIGFTFDHGTYRTAWTGELVDLPPARGGWIEEPLADVRHEQFVLDLDRAPREWLSAPAQTRGAPDHGDRGTASGGTLGEWFDVVVHTQEVSPAHRLG